MSCVSFCTAANYNLSVMAEFFLSKRYIAKLFRNVLYVTKQDKPWDIFFFHHGCFVTWNLSKKLIEDIKPFSVDPLEKIEMDRFIYHLDKENRLFHHQRFNVDVITLETNESNNVQIKLAIVWFSTIN